jgi:hypothetical protein
MDAEVEVPSSKLGAPERHAQLRNSVVAVEQGCRDDHLEQSSMQAGYGFDPRGDKRLATVGQEHDVAGLEVACEVLDGSEVVAVWS